MFTQMFLASKISIELSELDWVHEFNFSIASLDELGSALLNGLSFDVDSGSSSLGVSLLLVVLTNTVLESFTTVGHTDVLGSHMDALWDDAVSNALVYNDSDSMLGNVEHSSSLSVVEFVRHTSLDRSISNNINVVSLFVRNQISAEWDHSVLSKCFREKISGSSSKTEAVGHLSFLPSKCLIIESKQKFALKQITP